MKKIFRMALVFALAGATLMYTGCTKDYSEDINKIDSEVSSLENEYKALSDELNALKSSVSSLESAYKAADTALEGKLNAKIDEINAALANKADKADLDKAISDLNKQIAEINSAIAKKADAAEVDAAINQLKADALKVADSLQKAIDDVKAQLAADEDKIAANEAKLAEIEKAQKALDEAYAGLNNELRALVVIPDFYFAGVEATSFDIAEIWSNVALTYKADQKATDEEGAAVVFPKTAKLEWEWDELEDKKTGEITYPNDYALSQLGQANYNLNPSVFDVDAAEWSFNGMNVLYTKAEDKDWAPVFESISAKDGIATAIFSIENPEYMYAQVDHTFGFDADTTDNVPVIQLVADLGENKTIASDWEAVIPGYELINHLAFAKANVYETEYEDDCEFVADKVKDLYEDAFTAVGDSASVEVKYNGGAIDLAKLVNIHMQIDDEEWYEISLADLNKKYGDKFAMNFSLVPYTIGANVTSEDMYGQLEGSEFTPCYVESVDGKAKSIAIEKDAETGISSVGRKPLVLVTLTDEAGIVAAYGYFKIIIVKEEVSAIPEYFDLPSFGKVPFICSPVKKATTWHEFSYFVLEALGVDYAEFIANYTFDGVYANEIVKENKKDVEKFIKLDPQDKYGAVEYTKDNSGSGINDAISWTINPQQIGEGKTKEVFVKFAGPKEVYFKLTADVAKKAAFDFGANKIANEWYDDIDAEAKNTVRINVLVPSATDDDVTEFYRDLNRFYIGYKPAAAVTADSDQIYKDIAAKKVKEISDTVLATESTFYFAAEQPVINGKQLVANEWGDSLFVAAYDAKGKMITEKIKINNQDVEVPVLYDSLLIASFDSSAVIYKWEEGETAAKELLNLWSYTETDQAKMLYANIYVRTTYGGCEIPAGDENFHVRFIRPLDINFASQDIAQESAVAGCNVAVAKFISGIVDWNKQSLIIDSLDKNKKPTGNMIENVIKGVNMYEYYQFDSLVIDLDNAERDHHTIGDDAARDLLANVTPEAQLTLGTVDKDDNFTAGESNSIDISKFANLKNAAINYKNDRAFVGGFTIFIPVKVYYSWGVLNAELEINVKSTSETDPK